MQPVRRLLPWLLGIAACVPIGEGKRSPSHSEGSEFPAVPGDLAINPHNLIANATFADGKSLPWTSSFTEPARGVPGHVARLQGAFPRWVRPAVPWQLSLRHSPVRAKRTSVLK